MEFENFVVEDITRNHDRNSFSCGIVELDNYLKYDARRHHQEGFNHTQVLTNGTSSQILGFFSFAAASLSSDYFENGRVSKLQNYDIPCLKLSRFALDQRYHGQGLGQFLLVCALKHACKVSQKIGAYAVIIDAKNDFAKSFYIRNGFDELKDMIIYLPIKDIRNRLSKSIK